MIEPWNPTSGEVSIDVTFETAAVVIDAEITAVGDLYDLVGTVMPTVAATLSSQRGDGTETDVVVDEMGRFRVTGLTAGPLRFVVRAGKGTRVVTDWVSL